MKRSTELINLPVISIKEGVEVGKVVNLVLNPQKAEVMGLIVQDKKWWKQPHIIAYALICGIGERAITIENLSVLSDISTMPEVEELLEKEIEVKNIEVITRNGTLVGKISEYFIEPKTGKLVAYEIEVEGNKKLTITQDKVLTIGKDVIVVKNEVLEEVSKIIEKELPIEEEIEKIVEEVPPVVVEEKIVEEIIPPPIEEKIVAPPVEEKKVEVEPIEIEEEKIEVPEEEEVMPPPPLPPEPPKKIPDITKVFEERQKKFLLGKKVSRSIVAPDGTIIINEGEVITEEIVEKAKVANKFVELSISVKM